MSAEMCRHRRVYRGVQYATSARFAPSQLLHDWFPETSGPDGPICPQPSSLIENVIGPAPHSIQDEDCLTLTITVPSTASAADPSLPVLFWIPGGNFTIGAGSWPMYDAARLTSAGDMIVVSVNYRLGPFGFMRPPGGGPANLGIGDILNALTWVQRHIAQVGGDPAKVTLAGQSAGALAVLMIMGLPQANTQYASVLMQSPPLGLRFQDGNKAAAAAQSLVDQLGGGDLASASARQLVEATSALAANQAGWLGVNSAPIFAPVLGAGDYPDQQEHCDNVMARARDLPVLIGTTTTELSAMRYTAALIRGLSRVPVLGTPLANSVMRKIERFVYIDPVRDLVAGLARSGARVYPYVSSIAAPDSPYGATHCSDIPFVFGEEATWIETPLLRGWSWEDLERAGRDTRQAWVSFVVKGVPASDGLVWKQQEPGAEPIRNRLT